MIFLNKKKLNTYLILILSITVFYSCTNNSVILVDNGVSNYEIVFMDSATESQYKSAELLKTYIDKISGSNIIIVDESSQNIDKKKIYIGNINNEFLNPNELSILIDEQNLFISGGSDNAIQNAVYEFLERYLNCRWYAPNVEEIPNLKTIILDKSIAHNYIPDITTRTVHSRLYYNNPSFAEKLKVTTRAFPHYASNARVHTFHKFISEENFYEKHPEYFALRRGKRIPTQLCLTNSDVYEIVRDSVASLFKNHPNSSVVSVSQNDNQQYCQCDKCSKIDIEEESPSGTMIRFVNKIAADFPDKTISTLAYQYTRKPCKTKPVKNVLITLCSIECDRSAPITEKCTDFADDIRGWHEITDNIRIWDYTTQFTNFLAPFPNFHTLKPNIQFFRDNSAKWVFEQHSNNPSELFELRSYLMAKLLWDPDANVEEIITEFTNGYYEEAGIYIKKYIDLVHKKIQEDPDFFLFLYGDPSQAFSSYLNPELLKMYDAFFDEAESMVAQKPIILQRAREARLSVDYAILEACRKNLSEGFRLLKKEDNGQKIINPFVVDKLNDFLVTCNIANITLMNEMGFTVQEYYDNYKKAIEVALLPNKAIGKKVFLNTKPKKYANEDPQVLTDGALGGNSFYSNWLGFEGNHMEVVIDLDSNQFISSVSTAFLQVTNHVVFFPLNVTYYYSNDNVNFIKLGSIKNDRPLLKISKVNDIKYFNLTFPKVKARYVKVVGKNMIEPPYWHHATGTPSWIFADEVIID
jgi:hypothetical protein